MLKRLPSLALPLQHAGSATRCRRGMRLVLLAAGLLAGGNALAQQGEQTPEARKPTAAERLAQGELVIAVTQLPANLNPLFEQTPEAAFLNGFLRRPLTAFDADWKLVCILCTELPTVENGRARIVGDGSMTVTFTLAPEARWGDGMPLTTRDVVFSWQALQTQPDALAARPWTTAISSIVAEDDHSFTVRWKQPRYDYNRLNDFPILPEHIERLAFRNTAAYRQSSRFAIAPLDAGLGYGPFRLLAQDADTITLEPSATWWGVKKPWFRRIILQRLPDREAVRAALTAGAVDLLPPGLSLVFEDVAALHDSVALPDSKVIYTPGTSFEHITFNLDNPIFQDVRVRQALFYAFNRAALNIFGFEERYQVAASLLPAQDPAFGGGALPQYAYDPARAAQLLDAAGWRRGADGNRYNAAGEKLRFAFTTSVRQPVRGMIQQVASNFWQAVGVEIVVDNVAQATLVENVLPERAFNGIVLSSWRQQPQTLPWFQLHSSAIPVAGLAVRGINFAGLRDPAMDAALQALASETRAAQQQQLWLQVQRLYLEKLPGLPLYFRPVGGLVPKALQGFPVSGNGTPASLWAEDWRVVDNTSPPAVRTPFAPLSSDRDREN